MLVGTHHVKEAYDRIHESLNNMLATFLVPEVKESPILEVFYHKAEEEKVPNRLTPVSEMKEENDEKAV